MCDVGAGKLHGADTDGAIYGSDHAGPGVGRRLNGTRTSPAFTSWSSIDGSTTNSKASTATVTNEAHQSISIVQNSRTGANTVQNAVQIGKSYDCEGSYFAAYVLANPDPH